MRLRFEQGIPISIEMPDSRTVSADLVDISLEGLGLRLSSLPDVSELGGDWQVRIPTLESGGVRLRFRVAYSRSDADGAWLGLSLVRSSDSFEHQKNRRLMRAAVMAMHQVRTAQWLSDQRAAKATKPLGQSNPCKQ